MGENKKKHLHELLEDDQEPFHLNHYISNLRSQMGYSNLRLKKQQNSNKVTTFPPSLFSCDSSCFFTSHNSPDPRKSPLFELKSPVKKKTHIPARTAAILLEAAARIQKQGKTNKAKTRSNGFGMFGSVLEMLRNRKQKPRLDNADGNVFLERGSEPSSSSSGRESFIEIDDKCFCESPFHLVLQTSPCSTSGHRTPHFTSPVTSPAQRSVKDEDRDETGRLEKVRGQEDEDKEEQCSPVSVLDPLEEEEEDDEDHQGLHEPDLISCSFEVVQRAKKRLLKKLRRFEKLAGLDQVNLEEKMSEEEEEYEESEEEENSRIYDSDEEYEDVDEAMARDRGCAEEEKKKNDDERLKKWRMLNAWRVGLGTEEDVDEVVRKDIREETGEWTRYGEEVEEAVSDLEVSIFFVLIDEFSNEFVSSCS